MDKFFLDTSILVEYLRGGASAKDILDRLRERGIIKISVITAAELYFGCRDENEEKELETLLDTFVIVSLTRPILSLASRIRRIYQRQSECDLVDMLIAATSIIENAKLVTLNIKHFQIIKELQLVK